ncbi:protein kinase [Halomonas piscis]|uniref:Protein kinase n=1 Tax=Halomonas piscis TaxID=3031727 RepID=A0ABY9YW60_9GAMM|nr:protein kinase [Halomonas piscis]WNK19016.1 protein kinase [Halomonas piscis]
MAHAQLLISYGQAQVTAPRRYQLSAMAVYLPEKPLMHAKGGCAVIGDSVASGAQASRAAELGVRSFVADYFSTPDHWSVKTSATRVLRALNGWCHGQSRQPAAESFVASLSTLVFRGQSAHLFHIGDTLVFRLRGAEFEQLSAEHVTALGGYRYPSRALGMDNSVDIDYVRFPLKQGDIFLFTTRAAVGTLLPSDYVRLIRQDASDLNAACERLVNEASARARERGYAVDPFCFQLARIDELPEGQSDDPGQLYGDLPIPPELSPGERLDGLEVIEVLARTAQSRVYRVKDVNTGAEVVMKAPSPELSLRNAYLEHFLLQQWVVERVSSPFVVRVVEPSRPRHYLYYLLSSIRGETLRAWAERHPQATLAQRLEMAGQLGHAVQALHHRGVLHQQINPNNVLVDEHGKVVLTDFSACHLRDADGHRRSGEILRPIGFTPHTAPEYALGDSIGQRSDQYGYASTVYWLLTGQLPYRLTPDRLCNHTDLEALSYRSARAANPEITPALDDTLRRALDPQRALRFRRLSELVHELQVRRHTSPPDAAQRADARRFWQGVAGILLLLLVLSWVLR